MKPTIGGTSKKPRYPIVETAAIAEPLVIPDDRPAILKTIGTTQDTPSPARMNPIHAGTNKGHRAASINPENISKPLS
ncbi:MAG: hypothetical protein ABI151_06355 [Chitinophagaceae bacterium]